MCCAQAWYRRGRGRGGSEIQGFGHQKWPKNLFPAQICFSPDEFFDGPGAGEEEEEELPAISAGPVPAVSRVRVPTPCVSTTRMGMQLPGWRLTRIPRA